MLKGAGCVLREQKEENHILQLLVSIWDGLILIEQEMINYQDRHREGIGQEAHVGDEDRSVGSYFYLKISDCCFIEVRRIGRFTG